MTLARNIVGTRLFLISYTPLWGIFAIRSSTGQTRTVFAALAVLGLVDAVRLVTAGLYRSSRTVPFESVSDKSGDASGYLATYLLPFIAGPPSDLSGYLAYGVYFAVAWAVFAPSSLGLVNPTLYVLGWRAFEVVRKGRREIMIAQDAPTAGSPGEPVAQLMGQVGWVRSPTRPPWTWMQRRWIGRRTRE